MLSITRGRHKRKPHLRNPQHQPIEGIWPSEQSFASSRVFVVDVGIHEVVLSVTRPIRWLHGALHGHVRDIVRYQGGLYIQDSVQRARVHLDVVSVWMQNGHSLASIGSIQQRSCPPAHRYDNDQCIKHNMTREAGVNTTEFLSGFPVGASSVYVLSDQPCGAYALALMCVCVQLV